MADIIQLRDLSCPEAAVFSRLTEAQLRQHQAGPVFIAESVKVISRALDTGYEPVSLLAPGKLLAGPARELAQRLAGTPIYTADDDVLAALTGYDLHRGVLCAMKRPPLPTVEQVCRSARRVAVLESIVDPTNVGAIFRSAAALGVDAVLLSPTCCDPLYRRAARVSMGTVFQVPWTRLGQQPGDWPREGLAQLRALGFSTAAMALREDSCAIDAPELRALDKLALVLGSEGDGLTDGTIAACDYTVRIPMLHGVDSLNVAAASAVACWELRAR